MLETMKNKLFVLLIVLLLCSFFVSSQNKYEREHRIRKSQFPKTALDLIESELNNVKRLKFYKETDSTETSFEAKFKKDRLWYSTEFDDKGLLKDIKILDRNNLILDIFANNAKTARAKIQVELAQAQYLLPRLSRMWTHLSKQKGGIGMKGPGETEIETDRRVLRDKITKLRDRLKAIEKQDAVSRKSRKGQFRVALVGYTNVGKSTLMNYIGKADVKAENKLFATLDATVRKVVIENPHEPGYFKPILLSDTVGFIRKLPHSLIESFKSTLAESIEADLLLHVVDISHSEYEDQLNIVNNTLKEIGAGEKPVILVFNKIDQILNNEEGKKLEDLNKMWIAKANNPAVFVSAHTGENIPELKAKIWDALSSQKYY